MAKNKLEQDLLNDYTAKFETLIRVCHLTEKIDTELYQLALKKAAGVKMLMDYLTDHDIIS